MLNAFKEHIHTNRLHRRGDRVLLAVSGGLDSVVMTHLYHEAGFHCAIAHCNFSLRGTESDLDQEFTEHLANRYRFGFHTKRFETEVFARDNGLSVQMAARTLRYRWFSELAVEHGYASVAVAHHTDDVAETMLLNLARGTGIAGMHGIARVKGHVVRPLLFTTRLELETYAETHMLTWREDASNAETRYLRNRIRHQVIPVLREINPSVAVAFRRHASLMEGYEKLAISAIDRVKTQASWKAAPGGGFTFAVGPVLASAAPSIVLYHMLSPFGISPAMSDELTRMKTGHAVQTHDWRIVRDRDAVAILPLSPVAAGVSEWTEDVHLLQIPGGWIRKEPVVPPEGGVLTQLPGFADREAAFLDRAKLRFPLQLRLWRHGDSFVPLGMKGGKLVSDFITDEKMDAITKEHVTLLISGGEVAWVIGHRIDDRFKVTGATKEVVSFRFHRENPV